MRNSKGVSIIALIITIIVIVILAAIMMSSGKDTGNKAQLAVFVSNFVDYADRVVMDSLSIRQNLGVQSESVNNAQVFYMVANGLRTAKEDVELKDKMIPVGYVLPQTLLDALRIKTNDVVVAYVIDDFNITNYKKANNPDGSAGYQLYGDTNGKEFHFITSDGHIFTLPGYALMLDDGTIQYTISNEKGAYYIVVGNSDKNVGDLNINGERITESSPIVAYSLENDMLGVDPQNNTTDSYTFTPELGRYTIIDSSKS